MEGVSEAIVDPPMKPVNETDNRKPVKELITKHRSAIDQVQAALKEEPLYDATKHDDLWCVRFILSHKKKIKDAIKAAKHTLKFRAEYKLDDTDIRFIRLDKNVPDVEIQKYLEYCTNDAIVFDIPDSKRGVVSFMNMGGMDQHGLVENIDASLWPRIFRFGSEWQFQWLDYVTRTTGLFTKAVRIVDMAEFTFKGMNLECGKRDSAAMAEMEDTYPQLLQTIYICHSSAWLQVPWRIMRPILPKRFVSKLDFINPAKNEKEKNSLLEYIDNEHLPVRFGGKYVPWPTTYPLPKK